MTKEDFLSLKEGDIVRGKLSWMAFVVTGNYRPHHVTAVRSVDITCPNDWDLVNKENTNRYPLARSLLPEKWRNKK